MREQPERRNSLLSCYYESNQLSTAFLGNTSIPWQYGLGSATPTRSFLRPNQCQTLCIYRTYTAFVAVSRLYTTSTMMKLIWPSLYIRLQRTCTKHHTTSAPTSIWWITLAKSQEFHFGPISQYCKRHKYLPTSEMNQ